MILNVNNQRYHVDVDDDTPLLWIIREQLKLLGTKFGCGMAQCGACTVHVDGIAVRSCMTLASSVKDKKVTTIEGLGGENLHPVQEAWLAFDVPQCGYCQSGQIMSAAALLSKRPDPSDEDIDIAMGGNLCRCGTYCAIRKAIHSAANKIKGSSSNGE